MNRWTNRLRRNWLWSLLLLSSLVILASPLLAHAEEPTPGGAIESAAAMPMSEADAELHALVTGSERILVAEIGAIDTLYEDCRLYTGYRYEVVEVLKGEAPPAELRWLGDILFVPDSRKLCVLSGYARDLEGFDIEGVLDKQRRVVLIYQPGEHFAVLPTLSLRDIRALLAAGGQQSAAADAQAP